MGALKEKKRKFKPIEQTFDHDFPFDRAVITTFQTLPKKGITRRRFHKLR
jgi:hypothetical protein